MTIKKRVSQIVGLAQAIIGGLIVVFGFIFFYDFFNIQSILGLSSDGIGLYLWIFVLVGILSAISGLFLFYER